MASVANSADQATDLLQKLSLETQPKALEIPDSNKKTTGNQFGAADSGNAANAQIPSYERSVTPVLQDFMDPSMCYLPNSYPSGVAYYYSGYDGTTGDWDDYSRYLNSDSVDMTSGVYGDNTSLAYHHGYGYAQYGPYTPTPAIIPQGDVSTSVAADQKPLSVETANGNSNAVTNGGSAKGRTPTSGYQDPRFGFDGVRSPIPWLDAPLFSDGQSRPVLTCILSGVDDTKLITKVIIRELQSILKNGRRPLLQLLNSNCSCYFSPDDLASLNPSIPSLSLKDQSEANSQTETSKVSLDDDESKEDMEVAVEKVHKDKTSVDDADLAESA